jgi:hypothetical protein
MWGFVVHNPVGLHIYILPNAWRGTRPLWVKCMFS